ncbi:putative imidazolonepropionase, partial [Armadillidium nasatum]
MSLLIHGSKQVVCISRKGELFKTGTDMNEIEILETSSFNEGFSIAVNENGKIIGVGTDEEIQKQFPNTQWLTKINATGKSIIPGLVDAHTHPVWAGDRVHEFSMKLGGASYMDVHKAGGGIHFTVEKTRLASEEELLQDLLRRFNKMSSSGTTVVECKSGYGLDLENELKMLRVIENARRAAPLEISSTFCGAHALDVENVDVFCEKGVFEVEESQKILEEAQKFGFRINFHAEELNYIGGVEMGASLKAESMSHLEEISEEGIKAMSSSGSVAVLLPTTAFLLRLPQPPARRLIEAGVPVALGTDFNPNAHCLSMPIVMFLACVQMRMSLNEALVASTLNAAHSLRRANQVGSIEIGKWANIVIIDAYRWEHLVYQLGSHNDIITHVIYRGKIVTQNK